MKPRVVVGDLGTGTERNLLPLAIGLITSYARSRPQLARAFQIEAHFRDRDVGRFLDKHDDLAVLALSCYVWNVASSLRFAREVKRRRPGSLIVLGGPSVPIHLDRITGFLREKTWVDVLVHNEGELTFAEILHSLASGGGLEEVQGISYRESRSPGGIMSNPHRSRIDDLDQIPSPYLNGLFDDLLEAHGEQISGALIETNRGCPYGCTFCEWGSSYRNDVKKFAMERVYRELDWIEARGISYVYAADANFGIFFERDLEIARRIAHLHTASGSPRFFFVNWLKNSHENLLEIADVLNDAGVATLTTMALQSTNQETLALVQRKNLETGLRQRIRTSFQRSDRVTYTELILGLPGETLASFREGVVSMMGPNLNDWLAIYLCQLVEASEMSSTESRQKFGFETRFCQQGVHFHSIDQDNEGELLEVVVGTSTLPVEDWKEAFTFGYLASSLYFYRTAFFALNYLRHEHGVQLGELIDDFMIRGRLQRGGSSVLAGVITLLDEHASQILASGNYLSTVEGFGDIAFLPQEAAAVYIFDRAAAFGCELEDLIRDFCAARRIEIDRQILAEVIRYQQLRMPTPTPQKTSVLRMEHDIPSYFDRIGLGDSSATPARGETLVRAVIPTDAPSSGIERVISRLRTSMACVPWDVAVVDTAPPPSVAVDLAGSGAQPTNAP